jgi:hypothetical protein
MVRRGFFAVPFWESLPVVETWYSFAAAVDAAAVNNMMMILFFIAPAP